MLHKIFSSNLHALNFASNYYVSAYIFFPFFTASRAAQHVAPPPGIVEIDSEKFACQW